VKRADDIITTTLRLFTALGLASVLAGCTTLKGHLVDGSSLNGVERTAPGQTDSGPGDYRAILSDLGPF